MSEKQAILVDTVHAGKGVDVDVYELCVGLNLADLRGFEIRTSTGYRAVFPQVHPSEDCTRDICLKPHGHSNACKGCHGLYHLEQIKVFAAKVAKTYGAAEKG